MGERVVLPAGGRRLRLCVPVVLALVTTLGAAPAGGTTAPSVTATAPLNQTMKSLLSGKFVETVVCTRACDIRTSVQIRSLVAKKLGFTGVNMKQQGFEIGTNTAHLSAAKPTKVAVTLTPEAKKRLAKATLPLQLVGKVTTVILSKGLEADWIVSVAR